jgi:hypothetical protein
MPELTFAPQKEIALNIPNIDNNKVGTTRFHVDSDFISLIFFSLDIFETSRQNKNAVQRHSHTRSGVKERTTKI